MFTMWLYFSTNPYAIMNFQSPSPRSFPLSLSSSLSPFLPKWLCSWNLPDIVFRVAAINRQDREVSCHPRMFTFVELEPALTFFHSQWLQFSDKISRQLYYSADANIGVIYTIILNSSAPGEANVAKCGWKCRNILCSSQRDLWFTFRSPRRLWCWF